MQTSNLCSDRVRWTPEFTILQGCQDMDSNLRPYLGKSCRAGCFQTNSLRMPSFYTDAVLHPTDSTDPSSCFNGRPRVTPSDTRQEEGETPCIVVEITDLLLVRETEFPRRLVFYL